MKWKIWILLVGLGLVGLTSCEKQPAADTALWTGPKFSVRYPAGWAVDPGGADGHSVHFEDPFQAGSWTLGLMVTIEWKSSRPAQGFSVGGGSHVTTARLSERHGPYLITVERHGMTDSFDRAAAKRSLHETMDELLDGLAPPADPSDP